VAALTVTLPDWVIARLSRPTTHQNTTA